VQEGVSKINKIALIIPCYNEEKGVGAVISKVPKKKLRKLGYKVDILVIDNNSSDKTTEVAKAHGAKVICEKRQGKGYALVTGFLKAPKDASIIVMIDGDNSYDISEIARLIEPIESGFADVIVGTRLNGRLYNGSMTRFNRYGNWFFTFLARVGYNTNVTDVCSGFFAWKHEVVKDLSKHLEAGGFSIEMDMITKMAKLGYNCYSVPISYNSRRGKSSLRPIKDGSRILSVWLKNLSWSPLKTNHNCIVSELALPSDSKVLPGARQTEPTI
jgi:dolichol-phosphate mannosyltransferase